MSGDRTAVTELIFQNDLVRFAPVPAKVQNIGLMAKKMVLKITDSHGPMLLDIKFVSKFSEA